MGLPARLDAASIACAARGEPVRYQPQMILEFAADPAAALLTVECDAAGLVGDPGTGRTARLEVVPKGRDAAKIRSEISVWPQDVGRCEISVATLSPRDYEIRALLVDDGGAEVARAVAPFHKPGPAVWSGNTLGLSDKVLPPWEPLKFGATKSTLECWGRRYDFGTFLNQVRSQGVNVLSQPFQLEAVVNGRPMVLSSPPCRLEQSGDTRAMLVAEAEAAGLHADVRHEIAFDGFTWTDLVIAAPGPVPLDELRLTWSMPRAQATLLHADAMRWINNPAGRLGAEGWSSPLLAFFWLGNEERGLSWYAESARNWRASPDKPAIEVVPDGDQVRVIIRLIAEPATVSTRLEYGFGMMATPVRPQPVDARRWRMTPGLRPTLDIVWPNGVMKWYGYPEPEDSTKFAARVEAAHQQRQRVVPYVNLNYRMSETREWFWPSSIWVRRSIPNLSWTCHS